MKHANREPNSYNHLGAFNVTFFALCVRFLHPWQVSCNVVLTLCFKVFMPLNILYMCSVFIFFNTDVILIKNVDRVFCQIFQLCHFRLVCL